MPRPRSRVQYQEVALPVSPAPAPARLATPRVIPAVDPWLAGEMFVSQHVEERRRGFAILLGSETVRQSHLTTQLLVARLDEPDVSLRTQIIQALADYFEVRGNEYRYPPKLRAAVAGHLRKFGRTHLCLLLETCHAPSPEASPIHLASLPALIERIPDASTQLARLAGDRTLALATRRAALSLIEQMCLADTLPTLEGLVARLDGQTAGQLALTLPAADSPDDPCLVALLHNVLLHLREAKNTA